MQSFAPTFLFTVAVMLGGCYGLELDSSLNDVFTCDVNSDCALGSSCVAEVCRDAATLEGPAVRVVDPPELAIFPIGETSVIPVTIAGEDLILSNGDSDEATAGYVEVLLDGAVVDTITAGDIEDSVTIASVLAPGAAGLHHIGLVARRLDGEPFAGEESTSSSAFWIDDGSEQIGILAPAPGSKVALGSEGLEVEVASLNFTFVNPGFVDPAEIDVPREGYVHLYIDADVPNCLPACNFEHQSTILPAGLSRVNRIIASQGVVLPEELGTARIQVVAQDLLQQPYYRDLEATDPVFHQVPVQSIVTVPE